MVTDMATDIRRYGDMAIRADTDMDSQQMLRGDFNALKNKRDASLI